MTKHNSDRSFGKRSRVLLDSAAAIFSGRLPEGRSLRLEAVRYGVVYFCLKIRIQKRKKKKRRSFCLSYIFRRFWKYFNSYTPSVITKGTMVVLRHATLFSPSRTRYTWYFVDTPKCTQTTPFPYTTQKTLRQLKGDIVRTGKRIKRFNDNYVAERMLMHHVSVDCKLIFCTHTQQKPPLQKLNSQTPTSLLCLFSFYSLFFFSFLFLPIRVSPSTVLLVV